MHHLMGRAATLWLKETSVDRNPADMVEVVQPPVEVAAEFKRFPQVLEADRILPPRRHAASERQTVQKSFGNVLELAVIDEFRFHDPRHTFASWYMMNGGDLHESAKILSPANIKVTLRYAELNRQHITRTGNAAREMWKTMEPDSGGGSGREAEMFPSGLWWPGTDLNRRRRPFQGRLST